MQRAENQSFFVLPVNNCLQFERLPKVLTVQAQMSNLFQIQILFIKDKFKRFVI